MKQKQFELQHETLWHNVELILVNDKKNKPEHVENFPALYRRLCQTLALAQQRGYSPALTDYLQKMVGDCHQRLYGTKVERPLTLHRWLFNEFPQRVREEWRLLLFMNIAFWGVALITGLLVWYQPDMAYHFMGAKEIEKIQDMYQSNAFKTGRGAEGDFTMFGYYIWNNVSIDFRTFAGGIFAGVPALLIMGFNGMHMGVITAVLHADSVTRNNFWPFVITHSSFEIIGMLLAGVAGMRLGLTLLHPKRLSRRHALYQASVRIFPVFVGATILTFIAAFFEAFFCANAAIPSTVKYIAGGICWTGLILFFAFAGRQRSA